MTPDKPERHRAAQRLLWAEQLYFAALEQHEQERTDRSLAALAGARIQLELAEREAQAVGWGRQGN